MAFGLFKKKHTADIIYMNGHVYTQDPAFPWATAVACKDGKVIAIGDFEGMDEIVSSDTQVIDLKEQYMFPGFIEVHNTDILKAFEDMYLEIDPVWDLDTVLEEVAAYAENTDRDIIFAYGYNENILADYEEAEDVQGLLDEITQDKPVLLLGTSGVHCWFNSLAMDMVSESAEEDGMQYISADYVLSVLSPLDFEEVEAAVIASSGALCDRGITSIFPLNTPDYFQHLYRDCLVALIGESIPVKQRLFSSLYINRPIAPELILHKLTAGKTACIELDNLITYDFLKLEVCDDENLAFFSEDALKTICQAACDKGYNIHLDALDQESIDKASATFSYLRSKGCKHNTLVLAADNAVSDPESDSSEEGFSTTWSTDCLNQSVYSHAGSVSEAVDMLTVGAAEILGRSREYGSIEQGKRADFTVFSENPFEKSVQYFSSMHASMTIVDSQVVYDLETACDDEMYDLLVTMRL
ncbi:MAG: amidohydrolase family protein [Emergencia sp.]|jgi:hypothetical protein|nr:amidohydrolase family protein [Emergencia sp.]